MLRICFPVSRLSLTGDIMATSTISYEYNESGSWATITPYAGLYYSTDNGGTKTPITESRLPIVSTLTLYYRDATQNYCAFAVFFNGSSTISYTALVVSGMGCALSNGDNASGAITVVTDAMQKSEAGGDPVSITFAQPAPAPGQHVSGLTVNGSTTSPASIAAGGAATIAYQYAADPPAEPVTLTFRQPEEGQNKVNQVRVSVNGGALSTASPVEIPAGSSAEIEYSYQPFDDYVGPVLYQPVSSENDNLIITPVDDKLSYRRVKNLTQVPLAKGTAYTIPINDETDGLLILLHDETSELALGAMDSENHSLVIGAHVSESNGEFAVQRLGDSLGIFSTVYAIAATNDGIEINVEHTNTDTPEVQ